MNEKNEEKEILKVCTSSEPCTENKNGFCKMEGICLWAINQEAALL